MRENEIQAYIGSALKESPKYLSRETAATENFSIIGENLNLSPFYNNYFR